ncbi:GPI anchored serine-threonine rich family protein [Pyxidicoccus sp. 3LG]
MKHRRLHPVLVALLTGALLSACGAGLEEPDTEARSTRQPAVMSPESSYAVFPHYPWSGETFSAGQTITIEWGIIVGSLPGSAAPLASAVKLELYKGGYYHSTIVESVPMEDWAYTWQIPADITNGSQYAIKLTDAADPTRANIGFNFNIQGTGCDFGVQAYSLYVARDQRTRTFNYEGKLELAGMFRAGNVVAPRYPATGNLSMSQGESLLFGQFITMTRVLEPVSLPVEARIWEYENGAQGGTDFGSTVGTMSLSCAQAEVTQNLTVTISEDSGLEEEGQVVVQFYARRL